MKKICFVFVLFALFSTASQAQFVRGLGIKAGATIAKQDWDYSISGIKFDPDRRTGLNIGVFAELLNVPVISLVTEMNYVQKGFKKEMIQTTVNNPDGTGGKVMWDVRFDYINLAALGKVRLDYGLFRPYLVAGPKVDFEINHESSVSGPDFFDDFNKSRVGFKAGIGSEINLIVLTVFGEVMYDLDLKELYENSNLKVNTNSFDLRLGILF